MALEPLKIGTYGVYFQDSFDKHIYPEFSKATGIQVESILEPTGEASLAQLQTASCDPCGSGTSGYIDAA